MKNKSLSHKNIDILKAQLEALYNEPSSSESSVDEEDSASETGIPSKSIKTNISGRHNKVGLKQYIYHNFDNIYQNCFNHLHF